MPVSMLVWSCLTTLIAHDGYSMDCVLADGVLWLAEQTHFAQLARVEIRYLREFSKLGIVLSDYLR